MSTNSTAEIYPKADACESRRGIGSSIGLDLNPEEANIAIAVLFGICSVLLVGLLIILACWLVKRFRLKVRYHDTQYDRRVNFYSPSPIETLDTTNAASTNVLTPV